MTPEPFELDVRVILRDGGEPFSEIMATVAGLKPGQPLRLFATFEPRPLFAVLARQGFDHAAKPLPDGDWEVVFTPRSPEADASEWPAPARELDNRDLDPPEPMERTLTAIEEMQPGEVLCSLLCREPVFLLPELEVRGHAWRGGFDADGTTYRLLVRVGVKEMAA